jgi:surface polysaccharide O-acyltransferase-like enzyme
MAVPFSEIIDIIGVLSSVPILLVHVLFEFEIRKHRKMKGFSCACLTIYVFSCFTGYVLDAVLGF